LMSGSEAAERLASDKETSQTFERFSQHLASNQVNLQNTKVLRFGKQLPIDPKAEIFASSSFADANAMLTRQYRSPFVVPSEDDV
jgi:hypothetical protein